MTTPGVISPAPREAWREVYDSDPNALLYHAPGWVDLLCSLGGYEDASRLYELPEGRLAVLPMVRNRLIGGIQQEASFPPAWGMGGLLASGGLRESDVAAMFADLASRRVAQICATAQPPDRSYVGSCTAAQRGHGAPPGPRARPGGWL